MNSYEIEDTSDWLGSPTPLETCWHQLRMYENEFEALTLQLQRALENVRNLVEMNDQLSAELQKNRAWMANLEAETTEQLSELSSLRMVQSQNETLRRQLQVALDRRSPEES